MKQAEKNLFWFDNVEFRTHAWPGLMWVTPCIQVPDVQKARDLYVQVFNFVPIFDTSGPENPELMMTRMRYRGANFVITKEGFDYEGAAPSTNQKPSSLLFYVYVDDVDETYKNGLQAGMESMIEPGDTYWGDRRARLKDPFGYVWDIAKRET